MTIRRTTKMSCGGKIRIDESQNASATAQPPGASGQQNYQWETWAAQVQSETFKEKPWGHLTGQIDPDKDRLKSKCVLPLISATRQPCAHKFVKFLRHAFVLLLAIIGISTSSQLFA